MWGLRKDLSTLDVRSIFADLGLERFVRGKVYWEGDNVRLLLTTKDSKGISKELGRYLLFIEDQLSVCIR